MSDILTPAERQMIDAYPECRIRRIPRGVTGEEECRWDGRQLLGGDSWAKQIAGSFNAGKRRKAKNAFQEARVKLARLRREKLRAVYSGQTHAQLGQMFGVSSDTIGKDLARLRKEGWIK